MKRLALPLVLALALVLVAGSAWAQSQPSAKATIAINAVTAIPMTAADDPNWATVHTQQIKTANAKDLFMNVALQCGIYTRTKSELKVGGDSSSATGAVEVRVLMDETEVAIPGPVIFDRRIQTLNTELYQALLNSSYQTVTNIGYVELILETLQAHAFNFVLVDVPAGVHTIEVQARVSSSQSGNASAMAAVGMGSTTIESVRMIKGEDVPEL